MKYYVVDEEGEVVNELKEDSRYVEVNNGDRVIRANSIKSYKEKKENTSRVDFPFIKVNTRWIGEVVLDSPLFGFLLKYITFIDNACFFNNGKPLNATNISRTANISYSTCRRQLETLIKKDAIKKVYIEGKYVYFVNPFLAMRGKWISNYTIDMFSSSKYREGVKCE